MNKLNSIFKNKRYALGKLSFLMVITLVLSSCLKNDNDYVAPKYSALSIYNASPSTLPFDARINNGSAIGPFNFGMRTTQYLLLNSGKNKVQLYKKSTVDSIKSTIVDLAVDKYYSLFVIDETPNPGFLLLNDSLSTPKTGMAHVRFINLSPDAGSLNLLGNDSTFFTDKAYKAYSKFNEVKGDKTYNFKITNNAQTVAELNNVSLVKGKIYTIWAKGISTATIDSLKPAIKVSLNY
jgi:hypothetical protein